MVNDNDHLIATAMRSVDGAWEATSQIGAPATESHIPGGKLDTRTWARKIGQNHITTTTYGDGATPNAGITCSCSIG